MVHVPIHQEDPVAQRTLLVDIVISMVTKKSTPIPPPTKAKAQVTIVSKSDSSPTVLQRLSELEKKVVVFSKVDHAEAIEESVQANIINEVKNQLPKLLPKAISGFVQPRMERIFCDKSGSFQEHEKHLDLYNALIGSIGLDEAILKDVEKGKKKRRRKDSEPLKYKETVGSLNKGKAPSHPSTTDKTMNADETIHEAAMETKEPVVDNVVNVEEQPQDDTWFNELVNAEKDPLIFDDLMASTVDFIKFTKNRLKKDKITKADLEGPAFKLLKGTCKNSTELEYNLEQCYLALSDQLDWANPEGDKYPYDISKPLPLQGPLDQKEYTFKEVDFSQLHFNDIEDMFLLYVQHKLHNLTGDEIVDLANALRTFTRGIIIQRRVEDPYTTVYEPRGVVYMNKSNRKRLMWADELYKFSDGTLKSVYDNLHEILHNFVLGYNYGMPKRAWTEKDQKQTDEIVKMIDNLKLERRIMRSLECFVGGRTVETDYRLLMRIV
ncbi:hypothetical protein Tco_1186434 [Tanacetum coccineum]